MPSRRTFARAILASAHSLLAMLRHPWLRVPDDALRPLLATVAWLVVAATATACPFCGVVGRSLAERRDTTDVTAVGEAAGPAARDTEGLLRQPFSLVTPISGTLPATDRSVTAAVPAGVEGTAVVFGTRGADAGRWDAIAADETLIAHVATAPSTEEPAAERLRWFAARLEHANPAIAADAFTEFGLAPFAAVRDAADAFDVPRLAARLQDPAIDQQRRGFYAVALGLAIRRATAALERSAGTAALHEAVESPTHDLRAGFAGILGGVLVAEGRLGLDYLRGRGLFRADTRPGDARHAVAALRFAWESLADDLPRDLTAAATAELLVNPAVTAECVVDLARYGRWDELDRVASLWESAGRQDPLVRRAVAGYLVACPLDAAREHRDRVATADPGAWQAALAAAAAPAR